MALNTVTATGKADGTAVIDFAHGKAGLQWVVSQISIETVPPRSSATVMVRLNGRYMTSSSDGSAISAQGPPSIRLQSNDILSVSWAALTLGDQCILTLFYQEGPWGVEDPSFGWVV